MKHEEQAPEAAWMPSAQLPVQSAYEYQAPAARFLEQWLEPDPELGEPLLYSLCSHRLPS